MVIANRTIGAEHAAARGVQDGRTRPGFLIAVEHVHLLLRFHIGSKVGHHQVRVATLFADAVQHLVKGMLVAVAVLTAFQLFQHRVQQLIGLTPFQRIVTLGFEFLHLLNGMAEDEDVLVAHFFGDFYVRTVQRTDGQRAVQRQLHVTGAGGLFTGRGNLLGNVRRRNQHLCRRHAVIRQEDHFQLIAHLRIVIDRLGHFVDRKDNILRQVVARRRFRTEQEHARYAVSLRVFANLFVQRQNVQQVQVLAFVLVQTFDLNIKNRVA